ncbi:MAG: hypothetical protein ACK5HT_07515 [Draconibacterium sp.]
MKIPLRRINFVQSRNYNYFEELKQEREFLLKSNATESSTKLYIPFYKRIFGNKKKVLKKEAESLSATGTYYLAGHAHSIPDAGNLLLDQSEGITEGITEKGMKVINFLLALNEEGKYDPEKLGCFDNACDFVVRHFH